MNFEELNALPAGRVLRREVLTNKGKTSHLKEVVIEPLFKTECSNCHLPFPTGEKVVRTVASNRVLMTKCLTCHLEGKV